MPQIVFPQVVEGGGGAEGISPGIRIYTVFLLEFQSKVSKVPPCFKVFCRIPGGNDFCWANPPGYPRHTTSRGKHW